MEPDLAVQVSALSFARGEGAARNIVFDGVDCAIRRGGFTCLVGPSGGGKSTFIGLIAGLLRPDGGHIKFPAGQPRTGVQFQADALFPWRSVSSNLGYALEIRGEDAAAQRAHAARLCKLVELDPASVLDRLPAHLSGGERRRVSLAMALSADPNLLLLDEATGSLDWLTRRQMQRMLQNIWHERGLTVIAVTHDVEEAIWLADRVLVMKRGQTLSEFSVPFPRPRTDAMRADPNFANLVSAIAACLSDERRPT